MTTRTLCALLFALGLAACSTPPPKPDATFDQINQELKRAKTERVGGARPEAVDKALLPPLQAELPKPAPAIAEPRFDLVVNNAPAGQVFMAIVSGTRYSMLLPPDMNGVISVNLKDVTVREALETIREIYGYEFKTQGTRIFIQSISMQTRVFQVNYLAGRRQGASDVRVTSGSISTTGTNTGNNGQGTNASGGANGASPGNSTNTRAPDSSRIYTTSDTDFWSDLTMSLRTIVGAEEGRQVIVNPMSGVIVVRALPSEQRNVENFLRATQVIVERQVMLEAKIIEVTLRDGYESGINWSIFRNNRASVGMVNPGTVLQREGALATGAEALDFVGRTFTNPTLSAIPGTELVGGTNLGAGIFGLAFRASNFAGLLSFLETQGNVHVLSSPRIATLNNQKAVLKVGSDEFFVTSVSTTTTTNNVGAGNTISPTITVQPFFSGIALDVTPQIDEENNIILHVHPSISEVSEKTKLLDLGSLGTFKLPLAASAINETDSIVRVQDGNIVAIGGLMKQQQNSDRSGLPGVGDTPVLGTLFANKSRSSLKSELVILLKPTIIRDDRSWVQDLDNTQRRVEDMKRRTITVTPQGTNIQQ